MSKQFSSKNIRKEAISRFDMSDDWRAVDNMLHTLDRLWLMDDDDWFNW